MPAGSGTSPACDMVRSICNSYLHNSRERFPLNVTLLRYHFDPWISLLMRESQAVVVSVEENCANLPRQQTDRVNSRRNKTCCTLTKGRNQTHGSDYEPCVFVCTSIQTRTRVQHAKQDNRQANKSVIAHACTVTLPRRTVLPTSYCCTKVVFGTNVVSSCQRRIFVPTS